MDGGKINDFITRERLLQDRGISWISLMYARIRTRNKKFLPSNTFRLQKSLEVLSKMGICLSKEIPSSHNN